MGLGPLVPRRGVGGVGGTSAATHPTSLNMAAFVYLWLQDLHSDRFQMVPNDGCSVG